MSSRGVIIALNAGILWGEPAYTCSGIVNHVVTVTGAVYSETDGSLMDTAANDTDTRLAA